MSDSTTRPGWFIPALLSILLAAALVRAPLLFVAAGSFRMTDAVSMEEAENIRISSGMLHKQTLNPHAFEYPSLYYYLSLGLERALSFGGSARWSSFLIAARALSLAFGLATIVLAAWLALRLGGPVSGLIAAALVAFDRTSIEMSTLAKPNAAQVCFLTAGLLALAALAASARLRHALIAAACFGLATAAKWLGLLGLPGLAFAAALATRPAGVRGVRGLGRTIADALKRPVAPVVLFLPLLVFGVVFLLAVPFALLSLKEFGMGFAQVFLAQGAHRRALPWWISLVYLEQSLGPVGFALVAIGLAWAVVRVLRWDGSKSANGMLVPIAWAFGYGALVLFAFARLPSYVDLLVPALATIAGCALVGREGWFRSGPLAAALLVLAIAGGAWANGGAGKARARAIEADPRVAAGRWLEARAADADTVMADQGIYVPDRIRNVHWNAWGGPDRIVYDETRTWGRDPAYPEWYGGHRQLLFRNAKWAAPESALATLKPRWVITSAEWTVNRVTPVSANDWASPDFDRALAGGDAGYVARARFGGDSGAAGPAVLVYERREPRSLKTREEVRE